MRRRISQTEGLRWDGVPVHAYKEEASHHRGVTRQVLFGEADGAAADLRYFEVEPGGHSSLERHVHAHSVMVARGSGRCLVGTDLHDLATGDLVSVPPGAWHQFQAGDEGLGFLCLVPTVRDRPERPSEEELIALRSSADVAAFIRV